jgi:hypothetical protein
MAGTRKAIDRRVGVLHATNVHGHKDAPFGVGGIISGGFEQDPSTI